MNYQTRIRLFLRDGKIKAKNCKQQNEDGHWRTEDQCHFLDPISPVTHFHCINYSSTFNIKLNKKGIVATN